MEAVQGKIRRGKKRRCRRLVVLAAAWVVALWLAAHLLLNVQFPDSPDPPGTPLSRPPPSASLREIFANLPAAGSGEAGVMLLDGNAAAWVERWRLLADARERLDISYFILKQDVFGVAFLGALAHKAHEGLRIRILLDAMGTKMSRNLDGNDYLDALVRTPNVSVRMYRPLRFRYLDAFLTLNPAAVVASDHDKILLADGIRGLIGGRNIATEYFADPEAAPKAFRDADALLTGARIGAALREIFEAQFESGEAREFEGEAIDLVDSSAVLELAYQAMEAWLRGESMPEPVAAAIRARGLPWLEELDAAPHLRGALRLSFPPPVHAPVRLLDSVTRLVEWDDRITRSLADLVRGAHESVFIQSPYLVLSREAAAVLAQAAGRGVRITVLTNGPASSDNPLSQAIFLEQWPELMARVPHLRLFVAGDSHNLHGKLAVIDGRLGLIGTYNLDPLSMALNSELVATVWSETFAERLLEQPRRLIAAGPPRTYEYRIVRDGQGRPRRDGKGRVEVAFGSENQGDPEEWKEIRGYRYLLRVLWALPGLEPLF
jgi:putative cardiolipin synthase